MNAKLLPIMAIAASVLVSPWLRAEKVIGGPNGGRLLKTPTATIEFVVTGSHHASIAFLDENLQAVEPGPAVVKLVAELPEGRQAIKLERTAHGFVSMSPLPEPEPYRVVLQVRPAPGERPANFRIDLDTGVCGGCDRGEYACTCDH